MIISKFLFFKCLFSQNSFGVFRDQQFEENGEDSKGTEIQSILVGTIFASEVDSNAEENLD